MKFEEHSTRDAVAWIAPGAGQGLLRLIPPSWITQLKAEHGEYLKEERRWGAGHMWTSGVNMGQGFGSVQVIAATGEIGFHKDPDFSRHGYLLILRAAGYNVTGPRPWRGQEQPQAAGDLICLRQKTHMHALTRFGTAYKDAGHLDHKWGGVFAPGPGRLWIAATLDEPEYLEPGDAYAAYENALKAIPVNKFKKVDVDR